MKIILRICQQGTGKGLAMYHISQIGFYEKAGSSWSYLLTKHTRLTRKASSARLFIKEEKMKRITTDDEEHEAQRQYEIPE